MSQHSAISKIIQTTGDLPAMPHIATLVMEKVSSSTTTPKELHAIIAQDQALAARVLKIANSSFYGCSRNITSLTDAIMVMGFNSIRSLVMTSVLNDFFKTFGLIEKLFWEHSLGCAYLSKKIAAAARFSKVEEAFLAGLLHDLGKVILNLKLPDKMFAIVQDVYNNPGTTFVEAEEEMLGFNHAQVGQLIAQKWRFAEEIEEAIGLHHQPEQAKILPALCHIVSLANSLCHKLEIGPIKDPDLDVMALPSVKVLSLKEDKLQGLIEEASASLASGQGAFSF